jgi:hypothetical protein
LTVIIPHGVSAGLDDSKEKTSVIPVEIPEIDAGRSPKPPKAVRWSSVCASPGGRHA